jgi:hypothetical protein
MTTMDSIPSMFFSSLWTSSSEKIGKNHHPQIATMQDWINLNFHSNTNIISQMTHLSSCNMASTNSHISVQTPSPFLTFEIILGTIPIHIPCKTLSINSIQYKHQYNLCAIIHHCDFHFTTRLFDNQNRIWIYDGQKNDGFPSLEHVSFDYSNLNILSTLHNADAHIYVYALMIP